MGGHKIRKRLEKSVRAATMTLIFIITFLISIILPDTLKTHSRYLLNE